MALHIMNQELYHDRTVQDWHRRAMPRDAYCMDLDLLGYCHVVGCRAPLYGIEATTRRDKVTTVLKQLATRGEFFGLCVVHDEGQIVQFKVIHDPYYTKLPKRETFDPPGELSRLLQSIRRIHAERVHLTR